MNNTGIIKLI